MKRRILIFNSCWSTSEKDGVKYNRNFITYCWSPPVMSTSDECRCYVEANPASPWPAIHFPEPWHPTVAVSDQDRAPGHRICDLKKDIVNHNFNRILIHPGRARFPHFSKCRQTKQLSSEHSDCYWRDLVSGRVDHRWHTFMVQITNL